MSVNDAMEKDDDHKENFNHDYISSEVDEYC